MNDTLAQSLSMAMAVVGGLGIFMLGMKNLSEGMQAVAGNSLRRLISLVTGNRFTATGVGILVTAVVQSSTVTTVIMVGLVNAGLMQFRQAIGIIFGANIGTTTTGWILALNVGHYGLPILGISALAYLFLRRDRPRHVAMAVMGIGMVFFGLELMKNGFAPMADLPAFVEAFAWFRADSYLGVMKCVLVGCLLTVLVQSSSATLGITIGLASTGVIPFTTAAALVLGENIGTTVTVLLASIGANVGAKRAAYAHVLFNTIGVMWITLIFPWYSRVVGAVIRSVHGADPLTVTLASVDTATFVTAVTAGIALVHSGFNITNTLLFLPFFHPFARLLERIVPEPARKEVARLKHLDAPSVDSPVLAVEQSRGEVVQMGRGTLKMCEWIRQVVYTGPQDEELTKKTLHREEVLDSIQHEVVAFLTEVMAGNVPQAVAEEGREQLRIAHEFEAMGDRLASVLKSHVQLRKKGLDLPADDLRDLLELHDRITDFLRRVMEAYERRTPLEGGQARETSSALIRHIRRLRDEHLRRMTETRVDPGLSLAYAGLLTDYRRIRAHVVNVHEAFAGE